MKTVPAWLTLLLAGCGAPFSPGDRIPFEPETARYDSLWSATSECSGLPARPMSIRWYLVEGPSFDCPDGTCVGYTEHSSVPRVTLASTWESVDWIVQHEMLHAMGVHGHPPVFATCRLRWEDHP